MSALDRKPDAYNSAEDGLTQRLLDRVAFQQLYDIAVDTCLSTYPNTNPAIQHIDERSQEQAELIARIGTRGLCNALDIAAVPHLFNLTMSPETSENNDDNVPDGLIASRPMRFPLDYIQAPSQEMVHMVNAFGEQLLTEAYRCLGTDANDYFRQLQEATTVDEQIAVFEWLSDRVAAIGTKSKVATEPGEFFYHPIRLSPKVLGRYPHESYEPTCLSRSILIASFLHKAGWQHMHAGLMLTQTEDEITSLSGTFYRLSLSKTHDFPDSLRDRLFDHAINLQNTFRDAGFHACCIIKLSSGKWYLTDPNFNTNHIIDSEEHIGALNTAYDDIVGMQTITPAIERVVEVSLSSFTWLATQAIRNAEKIEFDANSITDLLQNSEVDEFMHMLKSLLCDTIDTLEGSADDRMKDVYDCFSEFRRIPVYLPTGQESTIFDDAFEKIWLKFLLWEQPLDRFLERCRTDEHYLLRRIQDVQNLPMLIFLESMKTYILSTQHFNEDVWHSVMEVGLPTYRIGAAVLSDFAAYLGIGPSSSTWAGLWNSRIPLTEHGLDHFGQKSQSEQHTAQNGILWLMQQLRYAKQNGIIAQHISPS